MAVAGMHNVSAFGPFFRDSQSSVSRQWSDEPGTPRTRASSLLKMWRELEGDHVASPCRSREQRIARRSDDEHECDISEDAYDIEARAVTGSEIDHDDNNSLVSGQSSDLGEIERERVRQIFQEWMDSGAMGHSPNGFHLSNRSGAQWLGKKESERVKTIREWGQTNSQQRNNQALVRDGGAEAVSRIEQVREGMAVSHCETTARRPIRRLCGRQTLLDLLQRAQCERKAELQGLLEHRPVSNFTHRNRIQALLRGRFLRNETMIPDIRPSSVAARELGLLRQQHTVSCLREGFLSKLEKSASTSTNSAESDSWLSDQNHSKLESTFQEREIATNSAILDLESNADRHGNRWEFGREVTAVRKQAVHRSGNEEDVSSGNEGHVQEVSSYIDVSQQDVPFDVGSVCATEGHVLEGKATEQMSTAAGADIIRGREDINVTTRNKFSLENDILHSDCDSRSGDEEPAAHTVDMEGNVDEQFDRPVDSGIDTEEWVDTSGESMARIWQESSSKELLRDTSDNNAAEQDQMQESHDDWPNHDLQEAIDSWLAIPSGEVGDSVGRLDAFSNYDDNNVHSIELRELFSRRRVSGLLRSGFRESLDQVLQSHVERQAHTSAEWELENESSSPNLVDQDQRQQPPGDRAMEATERNSFDPASSFVSTPQPLWDEEMQGASLPHFNLSQHFGTEWEVVNELRNDMARLQQMLNSMQNMLEQCMDMQMELQQSVRQEVSAALNRSLTKGMMEYKSLLDPSSRAVSMGFCKDRNLLLVSRQQHRYLIVQGTCRCGHMCTCSKCADKLIQDTGKCPMCRALVVEAVRAYYIQ